MQIIGVTGGVASGKSTVVGQFARLGAAVMPADETGHEVLRLPHIEAAARQRWGEAVFGSDERIDREQLARIVFAGPGARAERTYLEQLTHPEIACLIRRRIDALKASGTEVAVVEAALLLEAGWDQWCDKIVLVEAPREARLARAVARGWKETEFTAREDAQDSLDQKRARVDVIIDNSGPPQRTQAQVEQFWASLFP